MLAHKVVQEYAHSAAITAGVLKVYQLLVEKALVQLRKYQEHGDLAARDLAQDILAQIQHGINLDEPAGMWLYEAMGIIWDAVEGEVAEVQRAMDLLRQWHDLLLEMQKIKT